MNKGEKAEQLFKTGLNCSQAVFVAFCNEIGMDETTAKKVSVGLGGGVGRLREICGAVSGAAMIIGFLYGGEDGTDKAIAYQKVQEFSEKFKARNKYIVCRQLRGLDKDLKESFVPDARTEEYYKIRPCAQLVFDAAELLQQMLEQDGVVKKS